MIKAQITNIESKRHQASNSDFLEVVFDLVEIETRPATAEDMASDATLSEKGIKVGDEAEFVTVIETRKIGRPRNTTKEQIVAEVQEYIASYNRRTERNTRNAVRMEEDANVTALHEELKDSIISEAGEVEKKKAAPVEN